MKKTGKDTYNPVEDQENSSRIIAYLEGLLEKETDGRSLYLRFQENLEKASPPQIFAAFNQLYGSGVPVSSLLGILDKAINAMHKALKEYKLSEYEPGTFLYYLDLENKGLLERLAILRGIFTGKQENRQMQLLEELEKIAAIVDHYRKKENILFPYLEKKNDYFQGLGIMWALHDEIRAGLKSALENLGTSELKEQELNALIGRLIFSLHGMILKEELILFPAASAVVSPKEWQDMQRQSLEYRFPFVKDPPVSSGLNESIAPESGADPDFVESEFFYRSETGVLDKVQMDCLLGSLPLDLTFVDENNRVRYFSRPQERIFPRSPAIIGRSVENCHPPASVDKVKQIIEAFRTGKKDKAVFWIQMQGKFILIQYFALRDKDGIYKGTLEASQDITDIRQLDGEKRLLSREN